MQAQPLIWKSHKRRLDMSACPHCGQQIKWIYDGMSWLPCDKEPALFMLHPEGKSAVVYNKQIYDNCLLYKSGDPRFIGAPLHGNIQHYYTCPWLIKRRSEYTSNLRVRRYYGGI